MSSQRPTDFELNPPGCLLVILSHCLACYGMSAIFLWGNDTEFSFWWVLLAPIAVPGLLLVLTLLVGNSELPVDSSDLYFKEGLYVILFLASMFLLRRCSRDAWIAYVLATISVGYLVFAWFWFAIR